MWRTDRMLLGDRVRWRAVDVTRSDDERAILVAVRRDGRTTLLGRGDAGATVALVEDHVERLTSSEASTELGWMSLPRGARPRPALLGALGLAPFSAWDWMATEVAPVPVAREEAVVALDPRSEADDVLDCLAEANPGTTADPTAPDEAAWVGVRGSAGDLVGVFGAALRGGRTPGGFSWHLHGLGVRPAARRRGFGAALTGALTRTGLGARADWVSLGLYADNDHAQRLYRRLGFVTVAEFVSYGPAGARRPPT